MDEKIGGRNDGKTEKTEQIEKIRQTERINQIIKR
jgi:hypothetical protein